MAKVLSKVKRCTLCGNKIWAQGYDIQHRISRIMFQKNICYDCAYWEELIAYPPQYMEVLENQCLRLHPVVEEKKKTIILGGKGKMRYFMRSDGTLFRSNDIWQIGLIPERFRSQLPNTVLEISQVGYTRLSKDKRKCFARGCFDRYNCFRYDLTIEDTDSGAFNTIPPKWKVGDEHCRSFLNLSEILSDPSSLNITIKNNGRKN